jgi:hypothetical protein
VVLTAAMPAMAQSCDSHSCTATIQRLYVASAGGTAAQGKVYTQLNIAGAPGNCTLAAGLYYTLPPGTAGYTQLYSLLQEAASGGKMVTIRTNDGGGSCIVNYIVLYP